MVRGAEDGLHGAGYTLVLADTDNDRPKERRHRDVMLERQVDGLLLGHVATEDPVVEELVARRPSRSCWSTAPSSRGRRRRRDPGRPRGDDPGRRAPLTISGHRVIGHVAGPSLTSTGSRRSAGFQAAVRSPRPGPGARRPRRPASRSTPGGSPAPRSWRADRGRPPSWPRTTSSRSACSTPPRDRALVSRRAVRGRLQRHGFRRSDAAAADHGSDRRVRARPARGALLLALIDDPAAARETVMLAPELVIRGSTAPPACRRRVCQARLD